MSGYITFFHHSYIFKYFLASHFLLVLGWYSDDIHIVIHHITSHHRRSHFRGLQLHDLRKRTRGTQVDICNCYANVNSSEIWNGENLNNCALRRFSCAGVQMFIRYTSIGNTWINVNTQCRFWTIANFCPNLSCCVCRLVRSEEPSPIRRDPRYPPCWKIWFPVACRPVENYIWYKFMYLFTNTLSC